MASEATHPAFESMSEPIDFVLNETCLRSRLSPQETEDFRSSVLLKLLEDDCRALRDFRGDGSPTAYLRTVVGRLLLDYRVRLWGRWRPSSQARRLGETAIRLERLTQRDGYSRLEAVRHLRDNHRETASTLDLLELAEQLPSRARRSFESEAALARVPAGECAGDRPDRSAGRELIAKVRAALSRALAELPREERALLESHFADGLTIADIARRRGAPQRPLYRTLHRVLARVRSSMEGQGVTPSVVRSRLEVGSLSTATSGSRYGKTFSAKRRCPSALG